MRHTQVKSPPLPTELPGPTPFYLVLSEGDPVVARYMNELAKDIKAGQVENISSILYINAPEGWCGDVTKEIAERVYQLIYREGHGTFQELADWLDSHLELSTKHESLWRDLIKA